jgi:hypothetical protein
MYGSGSDWCPSRCYSGPCGYAEPAPYASPDRLQAAPQDPQQGLYRLPSSAGIWPAAVGLFAFIFLELVAPGRVTIPVVLLFVDLYVLALLFGSMLYGLRGSAARLLPAEEDPLKFGIEPSESRKR